MNRDEPDTIEIRAEVIRQTDFAWLISDDGSREVWIPKSQADWVDEGIIEMPEWLAIDKGLE